MKAEFVDGRMMNSDLGVVNCARTSLSKYHNEFQKPEDNNLIKYLARNNHISPFFQSRLYFATQMDDKERLHFYERANLAGFAWAHCNNNYYLKGSLYGFVAHLDLFPSTVYPAIAAKCLVQFPVSWEALLNAMNNTRGWNGIPKGCICLSEPDIEQQAEKYSELYKLLNATVRVELPLFLARQVRTSQVGFFYSDLYVEGESFSYNEVSRRYVNDDPEFYEIKEWRVREGKNVKQGSTGLADADTSFRATIAQDNVLRVAEQSYEDLISLHIAPEQARILLTQSMYTTWMQTGSLHRWAQWLKLRLDPHVQQECQDIANLVLVCLSERFPNWSSVYGF